MSNKLSGTLTLRLPSGDNRFKAFLMWENLVLLQKNM